MLDAIVLVLAEQGYQIETARNGLEATTVASEFKPDLVILDMRMPKMSGSDACEAIRKTSDVPIIMFTSSNDSVEVKDAIKKGATDFVLKSTGVSVLTERVEFHLTNAKSSPRNTTNRKAANPNETAAADGKKSHTSAGKSMKMTCLIVDPDEDSRDIIKAVLTRIDHHAIEAANAAEAIEAFKQHRPDILITEWSLPDMDAFKMLSALKRTSNARKFQKFVMSTRLSPEAHRKASFIGITKFLYKPLDSAKVEMMISEHVRRVLRNRRRKASKAA